MSSCSESLSQPAPALEDETSTKVIDLLAAVAAEVAVIAEDTIVLGDKLAAYAVERAAGVPHADMQMFDLISQNAQAQARLLAEIVRKLSDGRPADQADLRAAIGTVPFHKSRQRLLSALDGDLAVSAAGLPEERCEDTDWF